MLSERVQRALQNHGVDEKNQHIEANDFFCELDPKVGLSEETVLKSFRYILKLCKPIQHDPIVLILITEAIEGMLEADILLPHVMSVDRKTIEAIDRLMSSDSSLSDGFPHTSRWLDMNQGRSSHQYNEKGPNQLQQLQNDSSKKLIEKPFLNFFSAVSCIKDSNQLELAKILSTTHFTDAELNALVALLLAQSYSGRTPSIIDKFFRYAHLSTEQIAKLKRHVSDNYQSRLYYLRELDLYNYCQDVSLCLYTDREKHPFEILKELLTQAIYPTLSDRPSILKFLKQRFKSEFLQSNDIIYQIMLNFFKTYSSLIEPNDLWSIVRPAKNSSLSLEHSKLFLGLFLWGPKQHRDQIDQQQLIQAAEIVYQDDRSFLEALLLQSEPNACTDLYDRLANSSQLFLPLLILPFAKLDESPSATVQSYQENYVESKPSSLSPEQFTFSPSAFKKAVFLEYSRYCLEAPRTDVFIFGTTSYFFANLTALNYSGIQCQLGFMMTLLRAEAPSLCSLIVCLQGFFEICSLKQSMASSKHSNHPTINTLENAAKLDFILGILARYLKEHPDFYKIKTAINEYVKELQPSLKKQQLLFFLNRLDSLQASYFCVRHNHQLVPALEKSAFDEVLLGASDPQFSKLFNYDQATATRDYNSFYRFWRTAFYLSQLNQDPPSQQQFEIQNYLRTSKGLNDLKLFEQIMKWKTASFWKKLGMLFTSSTLSSYFFYRILYALTSIFSQKIFFKTQTIQLPKITPLVDSFLHTPKTTEPPQSGTPSVKKTMSFANGTISKKTPIHPVLEPVARPGQ